jgi:CMP-N,N'-diacetyllegionaminic acid synthase
MNSGVGGILALIPARGGSKGLPQKNILPCAGRPLIAHTIVAALGARPRVRRVVVSTDDIAIADVSRQAGAEVPFMRPQELAGDVTQSIDVVLHALSWFDKNESWQPEWLLLLQPTSPLRTTEDILKAVDAAACDSKADSVISVVNFEKFHPLYARKIVDGALQPFLPCAPVSRRQELDPVYGNNGAIYLTRTRTIIREVSLYGGRSIPYVMPPERSLDIDNEFDLRLASFLLADTKSH